MGTRAIGGITALAAAAALLGAPATVAVAAGEPAVPWVEVVQHRPFDDRLRATWGGEDQPEGATYDVRVLRSDARRATRPAWTYPTAWQDTTSKKITLPMGHGRVGCVEVRARLGDTVSAWSNFQCAFHVFKASRLHFTGPHRVIHRDRLRGMTAVVFGHGTRMVLPGVPKRASVGIVQTYPGGTRSWGFRCSTLAYSDGGLAGDEPQWNEWLGFDPRPRKACRLVATVAYPTDRSFWIQAIDVRPAWTL